MSCRYDLTAYMFGELPPSEIAEIDGHLPTCKSCSEALASYSRVRGQLEQLPVRTSPAASWADLTPRPVRVKERYVGRWLVAGVAISLIAVVMWARLPRASRIDHSVAVSTISGQPMLDGDRLLSGSILKLGSRLVTDRGASARIVLKDDGDTTNGSGTSQAPKKILKEIGTIDVAAGSLLRRVGKDGDRFRFALERGSISARVTAPPRLFIVETPSSHAVDMGCAYDLSVDDDGGTTLKVTGGWVLLEKPPHTAAVTAGMSCRSSAMGVIGTPFREEASADFKSALSDFDQGKPTLPTVLKLAEAEDAMTLWNMLASTKPASRGSVYDRLAQLSPPPEGVTRTGVLDLDKEMLQLWREDIDGVIIYF